MRQLYHFVRGRKKEQLTDYNPRHDMKFVYKVCHRQSVITFSLSREQIRTKIQVMRSLLMLSFLLVLFAAPLSTMGRKIHWAPRKDVTYHFKYFFAHCEGAGEGSNPCVKINLVREGVQTKKTFLNGHCPFREGGVNPCPAGLVLFY